MLLSIYLVFIGIEVLFSIIAIFNAKSQEKQPVFGWMAVLIALLLAINSNIVEAQYCVTNVSTEYLNESDNRTYYTTDWSCTKSRVENVGLTYFWWGYAAMMLLLSLLYTIYNPIRDTSKDLGRMG